MSNANETRPQAPAPPWRVGRQLGRTLYFHDELVGLIDRVDIAERMVVILNGEDESADTWCDRPLAEDEEIAAAHPMRTERHHLYEEAMRLVGARHSKRGLVELVTWLLHRIENHKARPPASEETQP